ncbi:hypothetical protein [Roseobacter denitrificans]|uniref:hypothetical protein n=1 Tax=Roseobacter denitrificans TaxID=2434 RepID=UPI0011605FBF|nr:hypothetical protein [Roseobacter denitrificans]
METTHPAIDLQVMDIGVGIAHSDRPAPVVSADRKSKDKARCISSATQNSVPRARIANVTMSYCDEFHPKAYIGFLTRRSPAEGLDEPLKPSENGQDRLIPDGGDITRSGSMRQRHIVRARVSADADVHEKQVREATSPDMGIELGAGFPVRLLPLTKNSPRLQRKNNNHGDSE